MLQYVKRDKHLIVKYIHLNSPSSIQELKNLEGKL